MAGLNYPFVNANHDHIESTMPEQTIYNMSDEKDRCKLFGIVEEVIERQSFLLHNRGEVEGFSGFLAEFVQEEFGPEFHWIDLPAWYDKCQNLSNGGRLFSAVLDLKITLAFGGCRAHHAPIL